MVAEAVGSSRYHGFDNRDGEIMEPKQDLERTASVLGSAHLSAATVVSYTLFTAAAMLTFFFAFQGILVANFPALYSALVNKRFVDLPVGVAVIVVLCCVAVVFNYWSYLIVRIFIQYFREIISAAAALEGQSDELRNGVFTAMLKVFRRAGPQDRLLPATVAFFFLLSLAWAGLLLVSFAGSTFKS